MKLRDYFRYAVALFVSSFVSSTLCHGTISEGVWTNIIVGSAMYVIVCAVRDERHD